MLILKTFLEQFNVTNVINLEDILIINENYFLITKKQKEITQLQKKPVFIGNCLGRKKGNTFYPSTAFLDIISKTYEKQIIIDPKTEWLFICGRDIFQTTEEKGNPQDNDVILVMNRFKECIGIANYTSNSSKKKPIKRLYDIGDYLRRERTKKL